ncbi:MAG TPA: thioesterase family protein [Dongiaceae bacterium]|nr:thioesterase family protein [Dongiaceae bacterium]
MARQIETFRGVVYPWFCDFMGHMNTQFYCQLFDGATLHFLAEIAKRSDLLAIECGWVDLRQLIEYKHEVRSGELLLIRSQLTKVGNSSLGFLHEMRDTETETLRATSEHVVALFSLTQRKSTPLTGAARERANALLNGN